MGDGVAVSLPPFIANAGDCARLIERAPAMVVLDLKILGGSVPVIEGTRLPVFNVAEILRSYPSLSAEQIE